MPTPSTDTTEERAKSREAAAELARRVSSGDRSAEAPLVAQFSQTLMSILLRRVDGDRAYAEDLHQETFRIVLERLREGAVDDPNRIAGFIHSTAKLLIRSDRRKFARRKTYVDDDQVRRVADGTPDALTHALDEQRDAAVRALIDELPNQRDRNILYLHYILDVDKSALCDLLDLSSRHFDRVISRARARFKALIVRRGEQPSSVASALLVPDRGKS